MSLRSEILNGTRATDTVAIQALDGRTVTLRQPPGGVWAEVDALDQEGTTAGALGIETRLAPAARASWKADRLLVLSALVDDESWSEADLDQLPDGAVREIASAVRERRPKKGVAEQAARFRSVAGGPDDPGDAPVGDSARADAR